MPRFWEDLNILLDTHHQELMTSVGSHGGSLLLIVMKVMACHFVSNSHIAMIALFVMLSFNLLFWRFLCNS
jgi:hypothetical protein